MAASKAEVPISAYRHDMNTILMAISILSKSSYPKQLSRLLYNLTGNGKSNMAAAKLSLPVFEATIWDFPLMVNSNNIPVVLLDR